jgi:hypothetical protein
LAHWTNAAGQEKSLAPPNWAGKWRGSLTNFSLRAGAVAIEVTMEIGAFPVADNACTQFRSTFAEDGKVRQVKDYRLCRGKGADDLFIDEGSNGIKLTARLIGDTLVSPFKYDNLLLISSMRLHGDVLEEDILTVDDQPAVKGVLALRPRGIQRITLKRVAAGS